ncbi:MAG: hypothetical protein R3E77_15895 [Steroidobacteraceae bacterium]
MSGRWPLWVLLASSCGVAGSASDELAAIDRAYFARDVAALARLQEQLRSAPGTGEYARAFVAFRGLQLAVWQHDKSAATRWGSSCVEAAGRAGKTLPAEALALESACYGYLASQGGLSAIRNGSRSGKRIEAAAGLAPTNPRVLLVDALALYFRPAFVGGDKVKARALVKSATEEFARGNPAVAGGRGWGEGEAWYWLARMSAEQGDDEAARAALAESRRRLPNWRRLDEPLIQGAR